MMMYSLVATTDNIKSKRNRASNETLILHHIIRRERIEKYEYKFVLLIYQNYCGCYGNIHERPLRIWVQVLAEASTLFLILCSKTRNEVIIVNRLNLEIPHKK